MDAISKALTVRGEIAKSDYWHEYRRAVEQVVEVLVKEKGVEAAINELIAFEMKQPREYFEEMLRGSLGGLSEAGQKVFRERYLRYEFRDGEVPENYKGPHPGDTGLIRKSD